MLIRNDDVAADTTLREIKIFCELCDKYGITPMHAITPIGNVRGVDCKWSNAEIRERTGTALFSENTEVVDYLGTRDESDKFAIHGLWHTHEPVESEISAAFSLLPFYAEFFVPPFNEWTGSLEIELDGLPESCLTVCGAGVPRLEDFLESGDPGAEIVYLHSWRFEHGPFTWEQLDRCLARLTQQ